MLKTFLNANVKHVVAVVAVVVKRKSKNCQKEIESRFTGGLGCTVQSRVSFKMADQRVSCGRDFFCVPDLAGALKNATNGGYG